MWKVFSLKYESLKIKKKTKNVLCGAEWIYVTLFWVFVLWVCAEMERYFISFDFISPTQIIDRIFSLSVVFIFFNFFSCPIIFCLFVSYTLFLTLLFCLFCCSAGQFQRDHPAWPPAGNWRHGANPGEMWRYGARFIHFLCGGYIQISCSLCENLERKRISFPEFETWVVRNTSVFSFNR